MPVSESVIEREDFHCTHDCYAQGCEVYEDNAGGLHLYITDDEGDLVWAHDYSAHPREVSDCAYDVKNYLCGAFNIDHIDLLDCISPCDSDAALQDLNDFRSMDAMRNGSASCIFDASARNGYVYFAGQDFPYAYPGVSGSNFLAHFNIKIE